MCLQNTYFTVLTPHWLYSAILSLSHRDEIQETYRRKIKKKKRKKPDVHCASLETGEKLRNKGPPRPFSQAPTGSGRLVWMGSVLPFSQALTSSGRLAWMGSVAGQGRRVASGLLPTERTPQCTFSDLAGVCYNT